jgi:phytanoyl-CoA hydroxylase
MNTASTNPLSSEQIEQFRSDGFVAVRELLSSAEVEEIRETFMRQAEDGPVEGLSEIRHNNAAYDPADPLAYYPRMFHPHEHPDKPVGVVSRRYMLDGRLESILRELFDEEPLAVQSMFYFKPPGARGQDLHQDNFYLRVAPGTCLAAWIAIDDADEDNGGMMCVPNTQSYPIQCPEQADASRFFTTDHVEPPAGLEPETVRLKRGDVLFFNGNVIHGSHPNTSATRFRRSLICHYVPRSTTELAAWYRSAYTFSGDRLALEEAQGGGPCGDLQVAAGPH